MARITTKLDDLDRSASNLLALLDEVRAAGLDAADQTLTDELDSFDIERVRLVARWGADHPRVAALDAEAREIELRRAGVRSDLQALLGSVLPEPAAEDSARVIGRVTDPSGLGLGGAKVVARDAEGVIVARATTDDSGAYALDLAVAERGAVRLEVSHRSKVIHSDKTAFRVRPEDVVWRPIIH